MASYAEFAIRLTKTISQHIAGADSNAMSRRSENRSMCGIADEQTRAADRKLRAVIIDLFAACDLAPASSPLGDRR
jgi:hypothetical protein